MDCYVEYDTKSPCPKCGEFLTEHRCPDGSCTVCLGTHGGFTCRKCGWSGDFEDVRPATLTIEGEAMSDLVKRLNETLGGIETPAMDGDNLAITLCSHFDDGEDHDNDHGWSNAAHDGYMEIIEAIRKHYAPAAARIEALEAALKPFADEMKKRAFKAHPHWPDSQAFIGFKFTLGDLRRAASLLEPKT